MFHKGCCTQSKTEDYDDKEQTSPVASIFITALNPRNMLSRRSTEESPLGSVPVYQFSAFSILRQLGSKA
jgi:hypothetical protein